MLWQWTFGVVGVLAGLFLLDRAALWAERRGWIYWRKKQSSFAGSGAVLAIAADAFQPNRVAYVQELEHKRIVRQQVTSPDVPQSGASAWREPDVDASWWIL